MWCVVCVVNSSKESLFSSLITRGQRSGTKQCNLFIFSHYQGLCLRGREGQTLCSATRKLFWVSRVPEIKVCLLLWICNVRWLAAEALPKLEWIWNIWSFDKKKILLLCQFLTEFCNTSDLCPLLPSYPKLMCGVIYLDTSSAQNNMISQKKLKAVLKEQLN